MDYRTLKRRCQLEQEIISRVYQDNKATCHFDYEPYEDEDNGKQMWVLTLVTCNPAHNELFTMYTSDPQTTQEKCLDQAILYLNKIKDKHSGYLHYKVLWLSKSDTNKINESYFYGSSFTEIIGKFLENKDEDEFIIRSVEMTPMA